MFIVNGMNDKVNCKKGLEKGRISEVLYKKEIALCKDLSEKNGGFCCWGKCEECGVFPLLYKLRKGVLLEDKDKIKKARDEELSSLK